MTMQNGWLENTGWFGKLPGNGDFISHNLSLANYRFFQDLFDQMMLQIKPNTHRLNNYFNSPPIGFLLSSQTTGNTQGFIMPSVDKVGRAYPWLVINQQSTSNCPKWHALVQQLSINALDQNWNGSIFQDSFEQSLEAQNNTSEANKNAINKSDWVAMSTQPNLFQWFKHYDSKSPIQVINITATHCDWGQLFDV